MMAAASPRFNTSDTPESTLRGPRGDGYCLATWQISSMGYRRHNLSVGFQRPLRHVPHAAVPADALFTAFPQLRALRGVLPQAVNGVAQAGRVVRFHQEDRKST